MIKQKIKVLVVDDSALIRSLLSKIINQQPDMVAVDAAPDPFIAREMVKTHDPDVMTLDIEMPRMDGIEFLDKLMKLHPMPVVMVSTLTERGAEVTMRAMELGAVDFVTKPKLDIQAGMTEYAQDITDKIRAAALAKHRIKRRISSQQTSPVRAPVVASLGSQFASTEKLIMIGASTGGTEAIREVLMGFPPDSPGIMITQHMPAGFTKSFAERLDKVCKITVKEAQQGERVLPGHAYIAPGSHHLSLKRSGANYLCELSDGPPVNRHRPSVEVLFRSGAQVAGPNIVGIMLTGMGKDGAAAMRELRDAGAYNFAQDEASCVVFGMPREAIAAGAVHETLPLQEIARRVVEHLSRIGARTNRV
ncbi:protein-glutamate methylesterase/protein-glutamine glutaminase [Parvibium lacunae]|uniref:Protein-glutamate methylesterase/protein-glutamine glutaminase n=1 Tax=Parvibium lacunae TaxID=1888893 RepID=A0A368L838_9BURK|nr:chemotaxis response regulator protein-glutamate methylesterase [Parvibium lacunae]RCS59868.1 chemotaxis response regulator protein-glutamate methylesterase [Parvibium lacunae]